MGREGIDRGARQVHVTTPDARLMAPSPAQPVASADRFDPRERARRHAIEMDKPAPDFFEGGVLGNGGMGVIVCTRPDAVVLYFGHNNVWDIRVAEDNQDRLLTFDEIWERLRASSTAGGHGVRSAGFTIDGTTEITVDLALYPDAWFKDYCAMAGENYDREYPRPWPCGSLLFGFDRRKAELLGHRVRIDTGVCDVLFLINGSPATLEIFLEMTTDRLWMRMLDADRRPVEAPFDRMRLIPGPGMDTATTATADSVAFRQVLPGLGDVHDRDRAVGVGVRVSGSAGHPGFAQTGPFVACVHLDEGLDREVPERPTLPEPTNASYDVASADAMQAWQDYWSRSGVRLSDGFLERIWYRNLYFFNCAVRQGVDCPGLFANWSHERIGSTWHGDYHTNYNLQQPFWVTFSANHVDKHLAYVDLVDLLLPLSRGWAREHYGLPGAFFPHSAYPVEMHVMPYPVPTWGAEVCETPWVVQGLWWHYRYTMDTDFLRGRAFGPIREAVLFLNAYIRRSRARGHQWDDDDYHLYPTVVPELHGLRVDPRFSADCNVDLTLTKFVFDAYLQACRLLGVERSESALMLEVQDILDHLPAYPTTDSDRGTVFVSVSGESPEQIYNTPNPLACVFPGEDVGLHSPTGLLEIALRTWQNQRTEGGNELVFQNLQGARLGVLDLEKFKRQIRYCLLPDGTCTDMVLQVGGRYLDETPFDYMARMGIWFENFSLPVVINECLLQSYTGQLRLFPNWPAGEDAAFQDLRAVGAFLVSASYADGQVQWLRVTAEVGGPLRVINPWSGPVEISRHGATEIVAGEVLEIETQPGEILAFRGIDD
jgi:alpha-L-fucosidase 2